jgi:imidazolonepropionase-like amidohydrolase
VRRAHAAGLRVSAHIYTAADFRTAMRAGVDIIAHFPGTGYEPELGPAAFRVTDDDASEAERRHVVVMTTLYWLGEKDDSAQTAMLLRDVIRPNWALLRRHGVPILIGSDEFRGNSVHEARVLVDAGLMSASEAVHTLSVATPKVIFPGRPIGELRSGFEASFLALARDPLVDFANVSSIAMRVKQGLRLQLTTPEPTFPSLGPE